MRISLTVPCSWMLPDVHNRPQPTLIQEHRRATMTTQSSNAGSLLAISHQPASVVTLVQLHHATRLYPRSRKVQRIRHDLGTDRTIILEKDLTNRQEHNTLPIIQSAPGLGLFVRIRPLSILNFGAARKDIKQQYCGLWTQIHECGAQQLEPQPIPRSSCECPDDQYCSFQS